MTPIARRAVPVVRARIRPEDVDWRLAPTKRAIRPLGWPFALFYVGPQAAPRRAVLESGRD